MEEIDSIIIESLKHLDCFIEDDINSLKQFDNDLMIKAIMACVDNISPGTGLPHILPVSMSQRLKLATNIAEHIVELGFRGDIGYQTILYCNEVEARRLLMFLIERLPREPDKSLHSKDSGRVSNTVKSIKTMLNISLKSSWLPSELLKNGVRQYNGCVLHLGSGSCYPLKTVKLLVPNAKQNCSEEYKQYCAKYLPDVTKQCSYNALIPSLLFTENNHYNTNNVSSLKKIVCHYQTINHENCEQWSKLQSTVFEIEACTFDKKIVLNQAESYKTKITPNFIDQLIEEVKCGKENIATLQDELKILETKKSKIIDSKTAKETELENRLQQLNIKSKSHTLLSNNENISKLKLVIENGNKKLLDLTQQWYGVQKPLLDEYILLLENSNMNESEVQHLQERLQNIKSKSQKAHEELREKNQLHAQLTEQFNKLSKQTNRSAYTRRILEIISNIKKQSTDIEKILADTRAIQKEINTLNGQLERSFALSDEIIFRDAKHEDTARKAYKLLASMHSEYEQVVLAVTELGSIIRETRNIQEQVDTEETREINARLQRVMSDLNQVRKETANMLNPNNKQ